MMKEPCHMAPATERNRIPKESLVSRGDERQEPDGAEGDGAPEHTRILCVRTEEERM